MTITKNVAAAGYHGTIVIHAEKPFLVAPKVFKRKILVDGVPHYRGEERVKGKWRYFNVAAFDKMFVPQVTDKKIKVHHYKGEHIERKNS